MLTFRSALVGLAFIAQSFATAASGETPESPPPALLQAPMLGAWARSVPECERPEFLLWKSSAIIQIEFEGEKIAFSYPWVEYAMDGPKQITVDLGKVHPYEKSAGLTSLRLRLVSADEIALLQGRKQVKFHRCTAPVE
jgi:hypothetical protein